MFLDTFGTLLADIMTIPPDISAIPSASAILDTSNFTIQAVTFGKNSEGYKYNAHEILYPSSVQEIKVYSNTGNNYFLATDRTSIDSTYNLYLKYITPFDTRLEVSSTNTNVDGDYDLGHNLNSILDSSLSSNFHLVGCLPTSGGTSFYVGSSHSDVTSTPVFSGVLSSIINRFLLMDASGYLNVSSGYGSLTNTSSWVNNGSLLVANNASSTGKVGIGIAIGPGDLGSMCLFGGIFTIGLWALDIRSLLDLGITPPYPFTALNNIRKYRLVAKRSFTKSLSDTTSSFISKFTGTWSGGSTPTSLIFVWYLNFL